MEKVSWQTQSLKTVQGKLANPGLYWASLCCPNVGKNIEVTEALKTEKTSWGEKMP